MDEREQGPNDIPTSQRMADIGSAMGNAMQHKLRGEHETDEGNRHQVSMAELERLIQDWPQAPRRAAEQFLKQYGPPNEATPTKLFWYNNGRWKRTMLTRDVLTHNFPAPHSDYVTQWIDYRVPLKKFEEIGLFDGSCLIDRTAGEVAARCDSEAANLITLNLMHEIVIGKRTVEEARKVYAEHMSAYLLGRPAAYAEAFQFDVPRGGTEYQDEAKIAGAMMHQTAAKAKDLIGSATPAAAGGTGEPVHPTPFGTGED